MNATDRASVAKTIAPYIGVALFAILHQLYVTRAHPDAPYMDSLRLLYQMEQWRAGHLSFIEFWGQHSQHRGFINQLFLLANIKFFSFNVILANRLTGIPILLVTLIVVAILNGRTAPWDAGYYSLHFISKLALSALIAMLCFSWAGFELLTLDLGLPLWTKNLFFVVYFAMHSHYLPMPDKKHYTNLVGCVLALLGPIIVLIIGMGWSYAFVASVVAVNALYAVFFIIRRRRFPPLIKTIPVAVLMLAQALYIASGSLIGQVGGSDKALTALWQVPSLSLYALGSVFIGVESASYYSIPLRLLQFCGGMAVVAAIYMVIRRLRRGLDSGSLLPLYLLAYGALMALSVSVARGGSGPETVMASRYYMDIVLFFIGLIWLWYEDIGATLSRHALLRSVPFVVFCLVVVVGQGLTYSREWRAAPYRAHNFEAMNDALFAGVPDEAAAQLLQQPLGSARSGAAILREHHLALFSGAHSAVCRADAIRYLNGWYGSEMQGIWMAGRAELQIPSCYCGLSAEVYLPPAFTPRKLEISGETGKNWTIDLRPGRATHIEVPPSSVTQKFDLKVSRTTVPSIEMPGNGDVRRLGALWSNITFVCPSN